MVEFRGLPSAPLPEGHVRVTVEGRVRGALHRTSATAEFVSGTGDRAARAEAVARGAVDAFIKALGKKGKIR